MPKLDNQTQTSLSGREFKGMSKHLPLKMPNRLRIILILGILFLVAVAGLSLASQRKGATWYEASYASWRDMMSPYRPEFPITTAKDAALFATNDKNLLDALRIAEEKGRYDGWRLSATREHSDEGVKWIVIIDSRGPTIPSFVCKRTFNEVGEFTSQVWPDYYCSFNK